MAVSTQLRKLWHRASSDNLRDALPLGWGVADQAVISASNFVMVVLLARVLGPEQFGAFALAQMALLFVGSMQRALITQPHNVLGSTLHGENYVRYTSGTFWSQIAFASISALLISSVGLIVYFINHTIAVLILVIAFATSTWQIQEFCRRVFYTQSNYKLAFANDLVTYGGQLSLVVITWKMDLLSPALAIVCIAVGSLFGSLLGMLLLRPLIRWKSYRSATHESLTMNWSFGKWLLGSELMIWLSSRSYQVIVAASIGVVGNGAMRAAENVMSPTNVLMQFVGSVVPVRGSRLWMQVTAKEYVSTFRLVTIVLVAVMGVYGLLVTFCREWIVAQVLGEEYASFEWLIAAYAWMYVCGVIGTMTSLMLNSMQHPSPVFASRLMSTVFTVTVGVLLVHQFGLKGAIIGMMAQQIIAISIQIWSASAAIKSMRSEKGITGQFS